MSKVIFILTLAVILALTYLALENPTAVQLKFFQRGPAEIPLYMVIFGAFILGALFVYVLFLLQGVRTALLGMRERRVRKRDARTDAHRQEARDQRRLGHGKKAQNLLEKAIQLSPDNLELYLDLGDLFLEAGEYVRASEGFHYVFSRDVQNLRAILGIATSSEGNENFPEAELYYSRVLEMERGNPVALRGLLRVQKAQGKWQAAMGSLRLLRKAGLLSDDAFDKDLAILWYEQGLATEQEGDLKTSISSFEKSARVWRGFVPAILELGEAHIRDGSPDRATKMWEAALTERFELPVAKALENHRIQRGEEKELIQFYKKISSQNELARILLARIYLKQDLIDAAEGEIRKIQDVEASPQALLILGEVEKKRLNEALSNRHYSLAFELLRQQIEAYRCAACGRHYAQWTPRCPACHEWNALETRPSLP